MHRTFGLIVALSLVGCEIGYEEEPELGSASEQVLVDNGIWNNGIWNNGIWNNGTGSISVWSPPFEQGVFAETYEWAFFGYPLTTPGLHTRAFNQTNMNGYLSWLMLSTQPAGDLGITQGELAESVLKYAYECAMNPEDGFDLPLRSLWGTTVRTVEFKGGMGLWPSWKDGYCPLWCQQEVTQCLAARTNAKGVHVDLSLTAYKAGWWTRSTYERNDFMWMEGGFGGNLFNGDGVWACGGVGGGGTVVTKFGVSSPMAYHLNDRLCGAEGGCTGFHYAGKCADMCWSYNSSNGYYSDCLDPFTGMMTNRLFTVWLEGSVLTTPPPSGPRGPIGFPGGLGGRWHGRL